MPNPRAHIRSSRRVPVLVDSDIDHEITLVNRAPTAPSTPSSGGETPRRFSTATGDLSTFLTASASDQPLSPTDSRTPLTKSAAGASATNPSRQLGDATDDTEPTSEQDAPGKQINGKETEHAGDRPDDNLVKTPYKTTARCLPRRRPSSKKTASAIDILYENQRGCFFCGLPLFSSAALGNLDPTPWTNSAHRPSPTDPQTAQPPDPSWVWTWPEWRVNRDEEIDTDGDGWEYSFMFSRKFSWHSPRWWNSFVRRRAWIRRRAQKADFEHAPDPFVITAGYFDVTPARKAGRRSTTSRPASVAERSSIGQASASASPSRRRSGRMSWDMPRSRSRASRDSRFPSPESAQSRRGGEDEAEEDGEYPSELEEEEEEEPPRTIDELMAVLRRSRIDREKLEAVEAYIGHCEDDLARLGDRMHEIMALFVFQASRQLLLTRLTHLHDEYVHDIGGGGGGGGRGQGTGKNKGKEREARKGGGGDLLVVPEATDRRVAEEEKRSREEDPETRRRKAESLAAAVEHADEEVRRLRYWSDIKGMAERGESGAAVDPRAGWAPGWEGLDRSGGKGPLKDELP